MYEYVIINASKKYLHHDLISSATKNQSLRNIYTALKDLIYMDLIIINTLLTSFKISRT